MNEWLEDPRAKNAEWEVFEAERAERRGDLPEMRGHYRAAGLHYAALALSVPATHPRTRGALGVAGVVSYARGGDLSRALELADRLLAEPGALEQETCTSIVSLASQYRRTLAAAPVAAVRGIEESRGHSVRSSVRQKFQLAKSA